MFKIFVVPFALLLLCNWVHPLSLQKRAVNETNSTTEEPLDVEVIIRPCPPIWLPRFKRDVNSTNGTSNTNSTGSLRPEIIILPCFPPPPPPPRPWFPWHRMHPPHRFGDDPFSFLRKRREVTDSSTEKNSLNSSDRPHHDHRDELGRQHLQGRQRRAVGDESNSTSTTETSSVNATKISEPTEVVTNTTTNTTEDTVIVVEIEDIEVVPIELPDSIGDSSDNDWPPRDREGYRPRPRKHPWHKRRFPENDGF